jgi:hypothetical protein
MLLACRPEAAPSSCSMYSKTRVQLTLPMPCLVHRLASALLLVCPMGHWPPSDLLGPGHAHGPPGLCGYSHGLAYSEYSFNSVWYAIFCSHGLACSGHWRTCSDPPRSARHMVLSTSPAPSPASRCTSRKMSTACAREERSFIAVAARRFRSSADLMRLSSSCAPASVEGSSTWQPPSSTLRYAIPCHAPTLRPSCKRSVTCTLD